MPGNFQEHSMNVRLLAIILALPGLAAAAPDTYAYPFNMMTGEELVTKLLKAPTSDHDPFNREIAYAYLNGIKDGTQGSVWCFTGRIKPDELNVELASALRARRTAEELKRNAAPLVLDELRRRFPCKTAKGGAQ
jgi:hypothetical protein